MVERELFGKILGNLLRLRRIEKDMTQEELEEIAGIAYKSLGKIERGERVPDSFTLYKIQKAMNISVDRLLKEVEKEIDS